MSTKISLSELHKLEHSTASATQPVDPDQMLEGIFQVKLANYVPSKVELRTRIDDTMFTGTVLAKNLPQVESDPNVHSIGLSKPMQIIR